MSLPDFNATIYFYSARESPYGCFSNFSRHGFELDGYWWVTNEHYFQKNKLGEILMQIRETLRIQQ